MTSTEPYAYWRAALQAKDKRSLPPTSDGDVHPGRYRMRKHKDGPWVPVAVWPVEGKELPACRIDGADVDYETAQSRASFFHQNPVTQAQYAEYEETGRWWDEVAGVGHNNPPDEGEDDHVRLKKQFDALVEEAEPLITAKVATQEQAEKHAAMAKALDAIARDADKKRKAEKQPHLDAGKAVDDKWRSLTNDPKDVAKKVKRTLDAYMREQERVKREEAERLRQEAMAQAKRSDNQEEVQAKFEQAQELEQAKTTVGTTGAKVRMREVVSAVITDFDKAAADPQIKNHPDYRAFVQQLCDRAVRAGKTIEGVERKETKEAA